MHREKIEKKNTSPHGLLCERKVVCLKVIWYMVSGFFRTISSRRSVMSEISVKSEFFTKNRLHNTETKPDNVVGPFR